MKNCVCYIVNKDIKSSAMDKLHQYRNIHTQMLRGALCVVDCGNSRQEKTESRNE